MFLPSQPKLIINKTQPLTPYPSLGNLDLIKTLNYGVTSKVKLGRDKSTNKEYAVKILRPEYQNSYLNNAEQEAKFVKLLNQEEVPNIVKLVEYRPKADYTKKNGMKKKVFALIFELAAGGDLFECIRALGDFREDIARTYFHQLIDTVESIHDRGMLHGDLKLENLLLSGDFSLKIADFSFARFAIDTNTSLVNHHKIATKSYMSPELLAGLNLNGQSNDLFASGVILFTMVAGQPPFEKAAAQDMRYRLIIKHQFSEFWKQVSVKGRTFSSQFKDLINNMLAFEASERLSIAEIKAHSWFNGPVCSVEELKKEYEIRKEEFLEYQAKKMNEMKKIKEANAKKKEQIDNIITKPVLNHFYMKGITPGNHRSITFGIDQELKDRVTSGVGEIGQERITRDYVFSGYKKLSEHFYNIDQETMFKLILLLSSKLFNDTKVYSGEYKIKGRTITDNDSFGGEVMIDITQLDENSCCVAITKVKGPLAQFYKFIEEKVQTEIEKALEKFVNSK